MKIKRPFAKKTADLKNGLACKTYAQNLRTIETSCQALEKDIASLSELTIKANKLASKNDNDSKLEEIIEEIKELRSSIFKNLSLINNPSKSNPLPPTPLKSSVYTDYTLTKKDISPLLKSLENLEKLAELRKKEAKELAVEEEKINTLTTMVNNVFKSSSELCENIKDKIKIL